ncbi:helix-turn-helix transcriptional regulator [Rhodococcus chondri]|uniref:Transcriptional regulator n=1 Tax=Rhodococcus chondri TaxID=3065941 RepID=A0ABU7JUB2_9NOCA|nr:transcriptional regulator [Rhodococcus sp. CC-R104]MEE2033620.1 transcriptional regulator [Rhodococcus sp. CC-R104]
MRDDLERDIAGIGALADPVRRSLYLYVTAQPEAVGREDAAAAVDLPVHSAKFHLDRLVAEGLLDTEFRRLSGRTGPGAGRPSKLYRRSSRHLSVSLPERRYDLAGQVLAEAIEQSMHDAVPIADAVRTAADRHGRRLAAESPAEQKSCADVTSEPAAAVTVSTEVEQVGTILARYGYEPRTAGNSIRLANCPFHRLASTHRQLVCSMNLALIEGLLAGLDADDLAATLAPEPGFCCVSIDRRGTPPSPR